MVFPVATAQSIAMDASQFSKSLASLRLHCLLGKSRNRDEYRKYFLAVKRRYYFMQMRVSERSQDHRWKDPVVDELLLGIEDALNAVEFGDLSMKRIVNLIAVFEVKHEDEFLLRWVNAHERESAYFGIRRPLRNAVIDLLLSRQYESAIVAAFKYLDGQIQKATGATPHEHYGESLMNHAFAPGKGKLQLNSSESEQIGLRNLFSGANAVFRNPSAHRFVHYDQYSALSVVYLVSALSELVASFKQKRKGKA